MDRLGFGHGEEGTQPRPRGQKRKAAEKETSPRGDGPAAPDVPPAFAAFREACKVAQPAWEILVAPDHGRSVVEVAKDIIAIVSAIGSPIPATKGYVRKTVIRSLLLACPAIRLDADWAAVMRTDLQEWAPDEKGVLEQFPATATAEAISTFMFRRPDWGLLVSMWGCMWNPVPQILAQADVQQEDITAAVAETMCEVAQAMQNKTGRVNPPAAVVRQWLSEQPGT